MYIKLTPLATAITLLFTSQVYAAGSAPGKNGTSRKSDGSLINLIGAEEIGSPGTVGAGQDGSAVTDLTPIVLGSEVITGDIGLAGGNSLNNSGGGAGGNGGASVIGGISQGGAGGDATSSLGNGGSGGDVYKNTITLTGTTLNGAKGGDGGFSDGSGGAGGHGGGSVFGGISSGGAGSAASSSANGGDGGVVRNNFITLIGATLDGDHGGDGGDSNLRGGGGAGGHGGDPFLAASPQGGVEAVQEVALPLRWEVMAGTLVVTPSH